MCQEKKTSWKNESNTAAPDSVAVASAGARSSRQKQGK